MRDDPLVSQAAQTINREAKFSVFKEMLSDLALLSFVVAEKLRYPNLASERRLTLDPQTLQQVGGYSSNLSAERDRYHPSVFEPFSLKAIWLPVASGELYSTLADLNHCPLIRTSTRKQKEILFFIHPKSEPHYQALLESHEVTTVSVLSLSAFRSVLVALPDGRGQYQPLMVKLSLDAETSGVRRLLSQRECQLSVVNSALLETRLSAAGLPLQLMRDPLAFVPHGYTDGQLYRALPQILQPTQTLAIETVMPLLAILGNKNKDFFQQLVQLNSSTVTEFVEEKILKPFAKIFIKLLFLFHVSIQGHGQNLLFVLDEHYQVKQLMYRDMGGVNLLPGEANNALPENLQDPAIHYSENHLQDAATALEDHFVRRLLFALTKQMVKNPNIANTDAQFAAWLDFVTHRELLGNWTTEDLHSDAHVEELPATHFCRYGYAEQLFARALMQELTQQHFATSAQIDELTALITHEENVNDRYIAPPCTVREFFMTSIFKLYPERLPGELILQERGCNYRR